MSANSDAIRSQAHAKSLFYRLMAMAFAHPDAETSELLSDGSLFQALNRNALQAFACAIANPGRRPKGEDAPRDSKDALEAQYIRLFQVGRRGRPIVSLNAGEYDSLSEGTNRPEFLLRFAGWYGHFGLAVNTEESNELPDHLSCQLEFMAHLCALEAQASSQELLIGYRRAQMDFLDRHLLRFIAILAEALHREGITTPYAALAMGLNLCTETHSDELTTSVPAQSIPPSQNDQLVQLWD